MSRCPLQQLRALLQYIPSWKPLRHFARPLAFLRLLWQCYMKKGADRSLPPDTKRDKGISEHSPFALASDANDVLGSLPAFVTAGNEPAAYPSMQGQRIGSPSHVLSDSASPGGRTLSDLNADSRESVRGTGPYPFTVQEDSIVTSTNSSIRCNLVHGDHSPTTLPAGRLLHERRSQKTYPIVVTDRYKTAKDWEQRELAYKVEPVKMSYKLAEPPGDWEAHTHPKGALYFFNRSRRIYTEAWIYDPAILEEIEDFAHRLDEEVQKNNFVLPPNAELVLELEDVPEEAHVAGLAIDVTHYWTYYYVNHAERVLFWLTEYDLEDDVQQVRHIQSDFHLTIGTDVDMLGRKHMEHFPVGQTITEALRTEVLCILMYANVDQILSESSTVSMKPDEMLYLTKMLEISKELGSNDYIACVIGRLMHNVVHNRYNFSFGQRAARLDRFQPIFDHDIGERSSSFAFISLILFRVPDAYLQMIETVWIDGEIQELAWAKCVAKLERDWQDVVVTATVLLNANISFLTINDVDSGAGSRIPSQLASYISTIASISATMIALLLVRQYHMGSTDTAMDATIHLYKHPRLRLEMLSLVHSLPYVLLMWAVLAFLLAFAFENFRILDIPTLVVATTAWGLAVALVALSLHTMWQGGGFSLRQKMRELYQQVYDKSQLRMREFVQKKQHANRDQDTVPSTSSNFAIPTAIELQSV
ncbi:uncharacterized protein B0H18DRAFT_1125286 [Fomitopsis serialis]|uniref:uncharacterized protein n=1 Tax=Fomitopsis serialis TaxID=139415 RepID=UPI0020078D25|nr:uncharacterized protein B0H18DRAFT_1125286 [Neoantrodia serialis]KAH9914799.1 hypothetical protein B0H18DRAFT_1125286 [Neoantrodia serialis]